MKMGTSVKGHGAAFTSILVWGTTFISTKVLLGDFGPIEILFFRFLIGLIALLIVYPHRLKGTNWKQELMFMGAGICGITLYFLMENIALTFSTASNVGVIVSVAPFFTALLANWFLDKEKPGVPFFLGFLISIVGIFLISFNGNVVLKLNPIGDVLALGAAIVWAVYSVLVRKISAFGYNTLQTTRRIFVYGLLFMIPALFFMDFDFSLERFLKPVNLYNLLFLGLGASALCFVIWNFAVKHLGAVKTSIYIYLVPAVTVVTSVIVLKEKITWMSGLGTLLIVSGLFVSEKK
jgi:drug/metabolite transporter (DMT)-like permease